MQINSCTLDIMYLYFHNIRTACQVSLCRSWFVTPRAVSDNVYVLARCETVARCSFQAVFYFVFRSENGTSICDCLRLMVIVAHNFVRYSLLYPLSIFLMSLCPSLPAGGQQEEEFFPSHNIFSIASPQFPWQIQVISPFRGSV